MNNINIFKASVLFFAACLVLTKSFAQQEASFAIAGISKTLYWENKPEQVFFNADTLTIVAGEKTDMFRDPNVTYNTDNAPKLWFRPDENFVLSACIHHDFTHKWDGGALVLISDSLHWVKFCFEKDYTGAKRVVSVVTKNISDDCNSVEIDDNKVYFKLAKAGKRITLYYSSRGGNWYLVRHFQFESAADLKLGFLAQSPTGNQCSVTFSDITYKAVTIQDPYLGE